MNSTRPGGTGFRQPSRLQWTIIVALNGMSAVIPGAYGVLGLADPGTRPGFSDPVTDGVMEYASLYGVRSVAIALVLLVVLAMSGRTPRGTLIPVLALAGVVQLGDCVLVLASGDLGQLAGPAICAVTHLTTVAVLARWSSAPGGAA